MLVEGVSENRQCLDLEFGMLKPVFENQKDVLSARTLVDSIRETVTVRIMNLSFHSNPGKLNKGELHPIESIHYPKNSTDEIPIQELGVPEYLEELLKNELQKHLG